MLLRTLLLLPTSLVSAAGVFLHQEVTLRALSHFNRSTSNNSRIHKLLQTRLPSAALRLGAFFPDWQYTTGDRPIQRDQIAYPSHGPAFFTAAVEYLMEKYGNDVEAWEDDAWNLLGVIVGAVGHIAVDSAWQSDRGLVSYIEEKNNPPTGEYVAFGADVLLASALQELNFPGLDDWFMGPWFLPVDDILAIYDRLGIEVIEENLRKGLGRGLSILRAERHNAHKYAESVKRRLPDLVTNMETYPLGGIRQMVGATVECWNGLVQLLEGREPQMLCPPFQRFRKGHMVEAAVGEYSEGAFHMLEGFHKEEYFTSKRVSNGYYIHIRESASHPIGVEGRSELKDAVHQGYDEPHYITTYVDYSHFGFSMKFGKFRGKESQLIVSAPYETEDSLLPQAGNVFFIPLSMILDTSSTEESNITSQFFYHSQERRRKMQGINTSKHGSQKGNSAEFAQNSLFGFALSSWSPHPLLRETLAISSPGPSFFDREGKRHYSTGTLSVYKDGELILRISEKGDSLESPGRRAFGEVLASGTIGVAENRQILALGMPHSDVSCDEADLEVMKGGRPVLARDIDWVVGGGEVKLLAFFEERAAEEASTLGYRPGNDLRVEGLEGVKLSLHEIVLKEPMLRSHGGFGTAISFVGKSLLVTAPPMLYGYTRESLSSTSVRMPAWSLNGTEPSFGKTIVPLPNSPYFFVSSPEANLGRGIISLYSMSEDPSTPPTLLGSYADEKAQPGERFGSTMCLRHDSYLMVASEWADGGAGAVWEVDLLQRVTDEPNDAESLLQQRPHQKVWDGKVFRSSFNGIHMTPVKRVLTGRQWGEALGRSLLCPGDINDDGVEDIIVGRPGRGFINNVGAVGVYLGKAEDDGE